MRSLISMTGKSARNVGRLRRGTDLEVKLTTGEFNLLMAFLKNPGRVLSREQLLKATRVYDQEVYDRSIDVLILRLRRSWHTLGPAVYPHRARRRVCFRQRRGR
ncbi:winged helix-turn-helix domain-containing protein [Mesorhizobium sp. BHbdii]